MDPHVQIKKVSDTKDQQSNTAMYPLVKTNTNPQEFQNQKLDTGPNRPHPGVQTKQENKVHRSKIIIYEYQQVWEHSSKPTGPQSSTSMHC